MSDQPVPTSKTKSALLLIGGIFCNLIISVGIIIGGLYRITHSRHDDTLVPTLIATGFLLLCNLLLIPYIIRVWGNRKFSNGYWFGSLTFVVSIFGLASMSRILPIL